MWAKAWIQSSPLSPLSRIHLFSCLPQIRVVAVVVQSLSCVWFFVAPWTAAFLASLSFTISQSLLKPMSIESVMPSNHLVLCHPLLPLPPIAPSIWVFSNESTLCIRWPKYWRFIFSISPSNKYSGLISFRIDWFDLPGAWPSNLSLCASAQELVKCFQLLVRKFSLHVLPGCLLCWCFYIFLISKFGSGSVFSPWVSSHCVGSFFWWAYSVTWI